MDNNIKKIAMEAAKSAGEILLKRFYKFDRGEIQMKSQHEILTKADLAAEKEILKYIKNNFPEHKILSEESGDNNKESDYLWIIDPLDGTTNFSMHNPLFCVSIGVAYKGEMILGVIFAPYLDEIYVAELGKGAKRNNKKISPSNMKKGKLLNTFCHGSTEEDIKRAVKYYNKQKLNDFDCRQLGSAAIELAYVACGRIESIAIPGANAWDVSAGALLVREAGGIVSDFKGDKWGLESQDILASNKETHKDLVDILEKI